VNGLQSIGTTQTELVKDPADPTGPLVYQDLTFTVDIAFADSLYFVVDDIGNGTGEYAECDETNNDLLLSLVSSVHGFKFEDIDGDGERDPEEPGMPGVLIYADLNGDGISNTTTEPHTLTMSDVLNTQVNEAGYYSLSVPVTGEMIIREVVPDGYMQTFPGEQGVLAGLSNAHLVVLREAGKVYDIDFGNFRLATIEGLKFVDSDDCQGDYAPNPMTETGDVPLEGITIYIDVNGNGELDRDPITLEPIEPATQTDEDGKYQFDDLAPGTYDVREEVPDGYAQSFPKITHAITIDSSGQVISGINFGNFVPIVLPDGDDELHGLGDGDTIYGDNVISNLCILSHGGDDRLYGEQGDDLLVGQLRNDTYMFGPATNGNRKKILWWNCPVWGLTIPPTKASTMQSTSPCLALTSQST
jgi:hypothetical protein